MVKNITRWTVRNPRPLRGEHGGHAEQGDHRERQHERVDEQGERPAARRALGAPARHEHGDTGERHRRDGEQLNVEQGRRRGRRAR